MVETASKYRSVGLSSIVIVVLNIVASASCAWGQEGFFERQMSLHRHRQFKKSVNECTAAIQKDEKNAIAFATRSLAYELLGEHQKSETDAQTAIGLDAKNVRVVGCIAIAVGLAGKTSEALKYLKSVEKQLNDNIFGLTAKARVFLMAGKLAEGEKAVDLAIKIQPDDARINLLKGLYLREFEKNELANQYFSKAIKYDAKFIEPRVCRALTYSGIEQFKSAKKDFDVAVKLAPENSMPYSFRGLAYAIRAGRLDKKSDEDSDGKSKRQLLAMALDQARKGIQRSPKNWDALRLLMYALMVDEQFDEALKVGRKAIEYHPYQAGVYLQRAHVYTDMNKFDKALEDLKHVEKLNPTGFRSCSFQALIYFEQEKFDKAEASFNRYVKLRPKFYIAYLMRGYFWLESGKNEKAIADFTKVIELHPKNRDGFIGRAEAYEAAGQDDKADADYAMADKLKKGKK